MSDEPQPLRLKPRPPSAEGLPPPPEAPAPPAPPGADPAEGTGRLRLNPRLEIPEDPSKHAAPDADAPALFAAPPPPPPPPTSGGFLPPEPAAAADPEPEDAPKFKLRPKGAGAVPPPPPPLAPPPGPAEAFPPPEPLPAEGEPMPIPEFLQERSVTTMPPMSILAAPLPPQPGSLAEAPAPPGAIPRLSLATPGDKASAPKVPPPKVGDGLPKIGGKPIMVKPGKTASVLRKRAALSRMAKVGLTFVIISIGVGGFYSYRIFFPAETPDMRIRRLNPIKPALPGTAKPAGTDANAKAGSAAGVPGDKASTLTVTVPKVDAGASSDDDTTLTPTPTPLSSIAESVMGQSSISKDVTVGNTPIDAAPAASAAFRSFVANANVGGVYQGSPAKALINGTVAREGQVLDSALGIAFERIDASRKIIYFKDYTGAEVSKNY
jgi:hypothetical protein